MKTITTILFLIISVGLFAQTEETVKLKTETGELEGTLLMPAENEGNVVALIIAGSGPTDRNGNNPMMQNNSLKMLAEGLAENGIASLRYDKRGVRGSQSAGLQESDIRFEHYVNDATAWASYLNDNPDFKEIIVIGHSEGSLIGMLISQKAEVDKFVSIAGVGIPANEIIRRQLAAQPPVVLQQANPILEKLEKGETVESVPPMLNALFRTSIQPYMISWFNYDPAVEIAKLNIPIQIVQGSTDIQVEVENAEILAGANKSAIKVVLEGMNHIMKEADADRMKNFQTYNQPDLLLKDGLMEVLVDFIIK